MIFKKIRLCGIERIHEGYSKGIPDGRDFGAHLYNLLDHCMASLELENLSKMEVFFLKKFSTNVTIIDKSFGNFVDKEKDPALYAHVQALLNVHDELLRDMDINKEYSEITNILPTGTERYHVIAVFNGRAIMNITGMSLLNLFRNEKGEFSAAWAGNHYYEEKIAQMFYESFYRRMKDEIEEMDILTDFMMEKKFYNVSDDMVSLAHINTPYGAINFFDTTQEKVNEEVSAIRTSMKTSPYILKDNIYLSFVLNTSVSLFHKLYMETPYIRDYQQLKVVLASSKDLHITNEINAKYHERINDGVNFIIKYKTDLLSKGINLSILDYLFNGNTIRYSFVVSLSDAESFLNKMESNEEYIDLTSEISYLIGFAKDVLG